MAILKSKLSYRCLAYIIAFTISLSFNPVKVSDGTIIKEEAVIITNPIEEAPPLPQSQVAEMIKQAEEAVKQAEETIKLAEAHEKEQIRLVSRGKTLSRLPTSYGYDLRTKSGLSPEDLNKSLVKTGLQGLGKAFIDAEQKYGVNALFLVAIAVLESAWGESALAREKNNLFGFAAYDSDVSKAERYKTKEESINRAAEFLSRQYLRDGGDYFHGYTIVAVNKCYSTSSAWTGKIMSVMNILIERIKK